MAWWVWVAFALANLGDIAVQGRDRFAAQVAGVLILVTGIAYVTAFRPRIVADETGITIRNPMRDHRVPWAFVRRVDLGDSLQVHCDWPGARRASKVLYGWAVPSARRGRARAEVRARRRPGRIPAGRPAAYGRMPAEAQQALTKSDAELIATTLDRRATQARQPGTAGQAGAAGEPGPSGTPGGPVLAGTGGPVLAGPGGGPVSGWSLTAIAALALPALLVVLLALA